MPTELSRFQNWKKAIAKVSHSNCFSLILHRFKCKNAFLSLTGHSCTGTHAVLLPLYIFFPTQTLQKLWLYQLWKKISIFFWIHQKITLHVSHQQDCNFHFALLICTFPEAEWAVTLLAHKVCYIFLLLLFPLPPLLLNI